MATTGDLKISGNPNLSEPSGLDAPIKMDRVISLNNESQKGKQKMGYIKKNIII